MAVREKREDDAVWTEFERRLRDSLEAIARSALEQVGTFADEEAKASQKAKKAEEI